MQLHDLNKVDDVFARKRHGFVGSGKEKMKNKKTQTDYRDCGTQTDPWKRPRRTHLDQLIEKCEISLIERRRRKNAWTVLLSPVDCTDRKTQEFIISMIDREEWAFRDKQLQKEADSKLNIMKDDLKFKNRHKEYVLAHRFERVREYLQEIRERDIEHIRREFHRNLRKLSGKYCKKSDESQGMKLELRKCVSASKLESQSIFKLDEELLKDGEDSEDLPTKDSPEDEQNIFTAYLSNNPLKIDNKPPRRLDELCIRETRWTDEKLDKLHEDLKKIRLNRNTKRKIHPIHSKKK